MKTQKCTRGWKNTLTSSLLILIVIVALFAIKLVFAIQNNRELNNFLNKKTVLLVNNEVLVNQTVRGDTINLYITSSTADSVQISDSTTLDTLSLDSLKLKIK